MICGNPIVHFRGSGSPLWAGPFLGHPCPLIMVSSLANASDYLAVLFSVLLLSGDAFIVPVRLEEAVFVVQRSKLLSLRDRTACCPCRVPQGVQCGHYKYSQRPGGFQCKPHVYSVNADSSLPVFSACPSLYFSPGKPPEAEICGVLESTRVVQPRHL